LFACILLIFVIVPLVLSGVFALRNVNKKELVVDYRLSAVNWGPWKMIISVDTNEITHTEQEPGSSDDFTESTPFVFDSTPDGIELSTQPPAYYVV